MESNDRVLPSAGAFLRRFGVDCGLRLIEIAPDIGLSIFHTDAQHYEGALLRFKGVPAGTIVVSRQISDPRRQRFTIAHEIGHFILPSQQESSVPCTKSSIEAWSDNLHIDEADANQFAAEILMPREKLHDLLGASPTFQTVRAVADRCNTSLTASACRVAELSTYRIAAVWSAEGRVRWHRSSAEFVRWIRKGALSPSTFAHDAFRGDRVPDNLESVPASAWLFEKGLQEGARILEQSILLPNLGAVLSLLVIDTAIEVEVAECNSLDPNDFTLNRSRWPTR